MNTYRSIEELKATFGDTTIYIRWSNSIKLDKQRGYSLRYGTQSEAGLSTNDVDLTWDNWRIVRAIAEYQFTGAAHCWIVAGEQAGRGGDNEPLLRNVQCLGEIDPALYNQNWKLLKAERDINTDQARLEAILASENPNEFAIEITRQSIKDAQIKRFRLLVKSMAPWRRS